ncbi:peptide ABC transporter substrate-binding protein [Caproiciproducens sp. CPB-2]|uniref:peptide ABC transporter substrate-binding protein n=1 Tax=Caproiciproducens sp. CPB-2 TaxID=3030017 RepID=UPI0023D99A44|nr:peptide ABC transporter substrate-binding protein [Caproiciproducens sp. CPB-2]MDF1496145.1 peptide ABC transporter substrate-binding protein [Caproiciproducens sp. CPB-2]
MKKLLSMLLCAAMLLGTLAGCGQKAGDSSENYRKLYSEEFTTMNYLISGSQTEQAVAANCVDGLIEYDKYGVVQPGLAETWETSDDQLTWTFHLRKGVKWVDSTGKEVADVKAQDFVDAAQYLLTDTYQSETANIFYSVVKNAEDYYNKKITDFSQVGVKAADDSTLVYTLKKPTPYFLSMLVYVCFLPANGDFLKEKGASFGVDNTSLLYNGAYLLTTYEPQVSHVYTKNDKYWDKDKVYIGTITETYNKEKNTLAPEMYKRGEIDQAYISSDILDQWMKDDSTKNLVSPSRSQCYSYFYAFNFNPKFDAQYEPDNWTKAVNNEDFRKSIFYGLDRIKALAVAEPYNPDKQLLNTVTPPALVDLDGTDYTNIGDLKAITARDSFQADEAKKYAEKAKTELKAAGATLPVKILMPYNPTTANWDKECQVVEQQLEGLLGKDYIDIIPEAGPSTGFLSATRRAGKYALMKVNFGPDYADPQTFTDPFQPNDANGEGGGNYNWPEKAQGYTDADGNKTYTNLYNAAIAESTDLDKRYNAFAKAEAFLINNAFVIPYGLNTDGYQVTKRNEFDYQYAPFGVSILRYKGQHLLEKPMSMDEFYAAEKKWDEERAAALAKAKK